MKPIVSLVKYETSPDSLRTAIDLCRGFDNLKHTTRVLIKPNLVTWDEEAPIPPFGVFTTTRLVEDLIILLQDFGCKDINIGEGSVTMRGVSGTPQAFAGLGYNDLAEQYGVTLVDFNTSQSVSFETPDGLKLQYAREAVETDFLIDVPVLKTHSQTKVSLGIKNLKGCLKTPSKKACHHATLGLDHNVQFQPDFVKPALTIIDGIFALERGPLHYGSAIRKNVLIASRDLLGADLVAAKSIGYNINDLPYLDEYSQRTNRPGDLTAYEIVGEKLADHITPLRWDWGWTADNTGPAAFERMGITGMALPKYDETLCSGCSPLSNMMNILVMSAFKGQPLPAIEVLNGKKMQARPGFEQTLLLGNCVIKANKDNPNIKKAVKVAGCPPKYEAMISALKDMGVAVKEEAYTAYLQQLSTKFDGKPEFDRGLYRVKN